MTTVDERDVAAWVLALQAAAECLRDDRRHVMTDPGMARAVGILIGLGCERAAAAHEVVMARYLTEGERDEYDFAEEAIRYHASEDLDRCDVVRARREVRP